MTARPTSTSTWSSNNGGPFDPAAYGGDEATALAVRQAFLKTIPRQEIVDRLIVPLNPDADDPQLVHPGARRAGYDAIAAEQRAGGVRHGRHRRRPGAARGGRRRRRRSRCGSTTPPTTRGVRREYELIRDSAAQAGFDVIDGNSPTWGAELAEHRPLRRLPVRLAVDRRRRRRLGGELRHRRGEQLLRLLQRGRRRRCASSSRRRPMRPTSRSSLLRSSSSSWRMPSA